MKPLLIATQNPGKVKEFQKLLHPFFSCRAADSHCPPVKEDGENYRENAFKKAQAFYQIYQVPVLADDSGLEVDCLGGAPGIYSARYGSPDFSWKERFNYLYQQLKGTPVDQWSARFRCVLCYFDGKTEPFFFEGTCEGRIEPQLRGEEGFGYDPLFFSLDLQKGFGEASEAEKARVSHRGRAVQAFLDWIVKNPTS